MKIFSVFILGLIFGLGLVVSGMTNPAIVLGFLDFFGNWNASLMFVMAGAVLVTSVGYRIAQKRSKPFLAKEFSLPTNSSIDTPLVVGATLFGIGWGLVGLCPGPSFAAMVISPEKSWLFFVFMLLGMFLARNRHRLPKLG